MPHTERMDADDFLQRVLPRLGYRWAGFRKPRNQVIKRIRGRMQDLGIKSFADYYEFLGQRPGEWRELDRLCDVTISKFFRDRGLWEYLRSGALPSLISMSRPLHIWSAGCASGEEPYSMAMLVDQWAPAADATILATDRNAAVLERLKRGIYPESSLKELTTAERQTYFRELPEGSFEINPRLRKWIRADRRDISRSVPEQSFDLVMCRNLVFTYFTKERQLNFLGRLLPHLKPGSLLIIGANETLPHESRFKRISRSHPVYKPLA